MKKVLLSLVTAVLVSASALAQFTGLVEDYDKVTPCFSSWNPAGNYQWFPGTEISKLTPDHDNSAIIFTSAEGDRDHADAGPAYYQLTTLTLGDGVEVEETCNAGTGIVDITKKPKFVVRMKASAPVQFTIYIQEGNAPSWNYSKFSQSVLHADVTTEYQEFTLDSITATNVNGDGTIDLSQIGGLAFSTEKEAEAFDGTITVDYFKLGDAAGGDIVTDTTTTDTTKTTVCTETVYDTVKVTITDTVKVTVTDTIKVKDLVIKANTLKGLGDSNISSEIKVFPNPTVDKINISITNNTEIANYKLKLNNSTGSVVWEKVVNTSDYSIDINALGKKGIYFLNIENDKGELIGTRRIILE